MDQINKIWPKWHTVELIGRGAFGEVYKVKREELGETFYSAVKVIRIPRDDGEVREFLSEGQTSQSIRFYYESIAKGLMNEIKVLEQLKSAGNVVNIEEFEILEKEDGIGWDVYIRMELLRNLNEYRQGRQMHWQEDRFPGGAGPGEPDSPAESGRHHHRHPDGFGAGARPHQRHVGDHGRRHYLRGEPDGGGAPHCGGHCAGRSGGPGRWTVGGRT